MNVVAKQALNRYFSHIQFVTTISRQVGRSCAVQRSISSVGLQGIEVEMIGRGQRPWLENEGQESVEGV